MKYTLLIALCILSRIAFAQPDQIQKKLEGYWLQEGYGIYLEIRDSVYKFYDITNISCQQSASPVLNNWIGSLKSLLDLYDVKKISSKEMILKYGITSYKFKRLKTPLGICQKPIKFSNDPILNFDVLWHTFKENYAYARLRKVDWDKLYKKYRPLISKKTTKLQLYTYFRDILDAIKDAHISLQVPKDLEIAYAKSTASLSNKGKRKRYKYNYPTARYLAQQQVTKMFPQSTFRHFHKDLLMWGKLNQRVGYIQINAMNGFSLDVSIPDSLSTAQYWDRHWGQIVTSLKRGKTIGQYFRDEIRGANVMIDSIVRELSSTSAIILDVRFNNGGTDKVALDILSRFVQQKTAVFSKHVWDKNNFLFEQVIAIQPAPKTYQGKIAILTSRQTASSAETLVLSSLALPNVLRIGSPTMGVFSDVLQKQLPNGWRFGLSNEIYRSNTRQNFESQGIPPKSLIKYPTNVMDFFEAIYSQGKSDLAIQKALDLFSK
ncbi:hypothetical protein BKI52_01520 [marine bacterium AO1-C]|nr:hypothetical protein BKI52_01520 [marine bacterium AO1-C]